ncbi:Hint domain-containing protein [Gemmobacter aquatilis]|uniref:Hint domain-containing protein n=1 Tax=Gemmobacter aquatilis TaxID=933059 RepID=A0A1H8BXT8_9RHOB|nr:Hint domain-containing protein [Gemmobacter aquatilis]SEM87583.1 Hint domain-containing protein [Gemmobacter aquatilis]
MSNATLGHSGGEGAPAGHAIHRSGLTAGIPVLTLDGAIPVEFLCPGDRIITRDGARSLRGISVSASPAAMVRVCASTIGVEQPEDDMVITAETCILVRDWRARALRGCDQAAIPAARLIDGEYIRAEPASDARIFTLEFDAPVVIYAGGLELALTPAPVVA